jgi:hypothetical protein
LLPAKLTEMQSAMHDVVICLEELYAECAA